MGGCCDLKLGQRLNWERASLVTTKDPGGRGSLGGHSVSLGCSGKLRAGGETDQVVLPTVKLSVEGGAVGSTALSLLAMLGKLWAGTEGGGGCNQNERAGDDGGWRDG